MLDILANTALRMLLVAAALWLALRLIRVRNPHVEALAWRMLLLAGLAMPVLLAFGLAPSIATTLELPVVLAGSGGRADPAAMPELARRVASWPTVALLSVYLAVALLLLGRLAAGLLGLWRLCAGARPAHTGDDVRISPRLRSPATFGSVILLPEDSETWPAQTRDAVLAHERAHVRSRDGYWSWLAQLHAAIFWFNPLVWWLRRRLETLAEITSDDAVVAARHDHLVYAALLLDFARRPNYRSVAMSVAESNVSGRIERLIARTPPGAELSRFARCLGLAALIPAVFLAASTTRVLAETPSLPAPNSADGAVKLLKPADPDHFYPAAAKPWNVNASILVKVDVDAQGRVLDAQALELPSADPFGFGTAAVEVARRSTYTNTKGAPASLRFRVKFAAAKASQSPPQGSPPFVGVKLKSVADPDAFYPAAAKQAKVTGSVILSVDVDPQGQVLDVKVLEPLPADDPFGFGPAAVEVARRSQYSNPSTENATIKFKVKFALTSDPPPAAKT